MDNSPHQTRQIARPYHGDSAIAALTADKDRNHHYEMYVRVSDLHNLAPHYLKRAIVRNAPTRALRSASDATLLVA